MVKGREEENGRMVVNRKVYGVGNGEYRRKEKESEI